MPLARHHQLALTGAIGLSSIAVFDAATHGLTGHYSMFSDDGQVAWIKAFGGLVHGLAYTGAVGVLLAERARIGVHRSARIFALMLTAALGALAAGFLTLMPFAAYDLVPKPLYDGFGVVVGVAFLLQFVAAAGLGFSLRRRPQLAVGSKILLAIAPVLAVTALIAAVAPDWAHPAYLEATTLIGVALLGTAKPSSAAHESQAARLLSRTPR